MGEQIRCRRAPGLKKNKIKEKRKMVEIARLFSVRLFFVINHMTFMEIRYIHFTTLNGYLQN